jgi:thioredoxin 1
LDFAQEVRADHGEKRLLRASCVKWSRDRDESPPVEDRPMLLEEFNWKKEVLQSTEPVLVDFWASWCPPCRAMNPVVQALAGDFKVCKVNVDKNQDLAARYEVSSIPAFLVFRGGKIAARHVGVTPEAVLRSDLTEASGAA